MLSRDKMCTQEEMSDAKRHNIRHKLIKNGIRAILDVGDSVRTGKDNKELDDKTSFLASCYDVTVNAFKNKHMIDAICVALTNTTIDRKNLVKKVHASLKNNDHIQTTPQTYISKLDDYALALMYATLVLTELEIHETPHELLVIIVTHYFTRMSDKKVLKLGEKFLY